MLMYHMQKIFPFFGLSDKIAILFLFNWEMSELWKYISQDAHKIFIWLKIRLKRHLIVKENMDEKIPIICSDIPAAIRRMAYTSPSS